MGRARYRKIREQNQRGGTRVNAVFTRSQNPKFSKKSDKKSKPQRNLLHTLAHAQWNRSAPLWRQTSYSMSIKWTQSHTSQHTSYTAVEGRPPGWGIVFHIYTKYKIVNTNPRKDLRMSRENDRQTLTSKKASIRELTFALMIVWCAVKQILQ